ncbi:MAG TPA: fibronectin type III domain-containing protein [Steroidobacteraceae bacterium]|nr:fibronectin type III domain-containing protein [Steroidobacteraceae bacterium]
MSSRDRDTCRYARVAVASVAVIVASAACVKTNPDQGFSGTATLTWTPIKTDTRGNVLKDLAGYKVRYGTSPQELYTVVVLKDPAQTTYVVRDLYPGTWYFTVSAYTRSNVESAPSGIGSKTIK